MTRRAVIAAALLAAGQPAAAETLADAVRAAAATNPVLAAARARQDALAETPEQARALGRLTAEAGATGGYDRFDHGRGGSGSITATLPIWTGGRVKSAVRATTADVAAGEEGVRDTAAEVLEAVVQAYADLLYQQQALAIARAQITLLDGQVAEANARFTLGTGTQTDVSRLVAQRASAQASEASAAAASAAAAATYRAVVGRDAGQLVQPGDLAALPPTVEAARDQAIRRNPLYRQAVAARTAAGARIDVARANGAPSVGVTGGYGYGIGFGRDARDGYLSSAAVGVGLRVPLLTGGLVSSQVREARADARAAGYDVDAAAREATRATDTAWANVIAARARVDANTRAVAAAERALAGVKAEYAVALRSTLDILIADESLRAAQLSLAASRSDLLTGETALLRATGDLTDAAFAG